MDEHHRLIPNTGFPPQAPTFFVADVLPYGRGCWKWPLPSPELAALTGSLVPRQAAAHRGRCIRQQRIRPAFGEENEKKKKEGWPAHEERRLRPLGFSIFGSRVGIRVGFQRVSGFRVSGHKVWFQIGFFNPSPTQFSYIKKKGPLSGPAQYRDTTRLTNTVVHPD
jgi:hypothetical protein